MPVSNLPAGWWCKNEKRQTAGRQLRCDRSHGSIGGPATHSIPYSSRTSLRHSSRHISRHSSRHSSRHLSRHSSKTSAFGACVMSASFCGIAAAAAVPAQTPGSCCSRSLQEHARRHCRAARCSFRNITSFSIASPRSPPRMPTPPAAAAVAIYR